MIGIGSNAIVQYPQPFALMWVACGVVKVASISKIIVCSLEKQPL